MRKNRTRLVFREAGETAGVATLVAYGASWRTLEGVHGHSDGFEDPSFDDSSWTVAPGAFGHVLSGEPSQGANLPPCLENTDLVQTAWTVDTDLCLRRTILVPTGTTSLRFEWGADSEAYIFLDGDLIAHSEASGCETRGSHEYVLDSPASGTAILAVRAIDTPPAGLNETFFDLQLQAIGDITSTSGDSADWTASGGKINYWSNIVANAPDDMFDENDVTYRDVLQNGRDWWCTSNYQFVESIRINWTGAAQSSEFYIEYSDDVDSTYLPVALGGSASLTLDPGGTWYTAIHAVYGTGGGGGGTRGYYDADGAFTAVNWSVGYPTGDFTFDLGTGVTARLWRIRIPAGAGNSDIGTMEATGTAVSVATQPAGRGIGAVVAVIEDMHNLAVSEFHNGPGELYFTLPNDHDLISVLLPWQTHWAYERYTSQGWTEKQAGWLVDYDATDDETVFYGLDYLGTLSLMHDERFNPDQSPDAAAALWPDTGTGSKYVARRIDSIVMDQIDRAIHTPNSNLAFCVRGGVASMPETVTIYCTLVERLAFIAGMLDSHRAGTGARTRIFVNKVRQWTGATTYSDEYRIEVQDNPGELRNDLTMRYGELVQGFRVVPFGNFATRSLGIGKTATGFRLEYDITSAIPPAGESSDFYERNYGRLTNVNYWSDIIDVNDLKRRNLQLAAQVGVVGKQLGLGIAVDRLGVKDGWEICDTVPVDIQRGLVDTTAMVGGVGQWTIWGWAAFINDDGSEELVLTLLPKEQEGALDPDLSTTLEVTGADDITLDAGDPDTTVSPGSTGIWVNTTTWEVWHVDPDTGLWVSAGSIQQAFALDDLTDVTITSAAAAERLRYNGSLWVNSALRWEAVFDYTGSAILNGNGDPIMQEMED